MALRRDFSYEDAVRHLQEIFGETLEPEVMEPMPRTPDRADVFRAHALGVRLDGKWRTAVPKIQPASRRRF